jgi:hypothetical protein
VNLRHGTASTDEHASGTDQFTEGGFRRVAAVRTCGPGQDIGRLATGVVARRDGKPPAAIDRILSEAGIDANRRLRLGGRTTVKNR